MLQAGVNYSYIRRDFDVGAAPAGPLMRPSRLTDVPAHKGFAYVAVRPTPAVALTPSLEFASDRTTVTPASANGLAPIYYETGGYLSAALRIEWDASPDLTLSAGGRNLFDRYYVLTDGFPEPGRSVLLGVRARY